MNIAIINAITGGFDKPKELPLQVGFNYNYYQFTEHDFKDDTRGLNDRTKALYFKSQMHYMVGANVYVWIDGKVQVKSPDFLKTLVEQLGDGDFAMLKHGERNCIYVEANYIVHRINMGSNYLAKRYKHRGILNQVQAYRREGYPPNRGLNDCSIFIWRPTDRMIDLMDKWWSLISDQITFDQTAIQYLTWKAGIEIKPIVFEPGAYVLVPHLKVA